jgi:hypothetical protein
MSACIQRVACPARLSAVRACLQSSTHAYPAEPRADVVAGELTELTRLSTGGGREEVCEVEVDRWVGCTLNTAVESLRGLSGSRA